ncbi:MAG: hydantoinase B/oxoprolinase family protein, partial [Candidatus Rokubacteria bacterium]|nr:hydantoinase B/oxoprolinase family protein [Candidatus Rokubacteria bacterium]
LRRGAEDEILPAKLTIMIRRGDVFHHDQPGTGGWGDPLERDPAHVLRDVRNEFVSRESARNDYGIALAPGGLEVDVAATEKLRAEMRAARGWEKPPVVSR